MNAPTSDALYLGLLLQPIYECAKYKPAFGRQSTNGVSLTEFHSLYGSDPLYHWLGLDSDLMYAAHKAAGGMTSIYRQLGIGCERLLRKVIKDHFNLDDGQVAWSYEYKKEDGKTGRHTLDARIDLTFIDNDKSKLRLRNWLERSGSSLLLPQERIATLKGVVLEVRQGYKSADSKRQNADLRFGIRAYNEGYLPIVCIVSTQASQTVCRRYQAAQLLVLLGTQGSDVESTYGFFESAVGYDLASFFQRNSLVLRSEFSKVLEVLLSSSSKAVVPKKEITEIIRELPLEYGNEDEE